MQQQLVGLLALPGGLANDDLGVLGTDLRRLGPGTGNAGQVQRAWGLDGG